MTAQHATSFAFRISLPVMLSEAAAREVLVRTGKQPVVTQVFEINDLLTVPEEDRSQLADIADIVKVTRRQEDHGFDGDEHIVEDICELTRIDQMEKRGGTWWVEDPRGDRRVDAVLFARGARTMNPWEMVVESGADAEAVAALEAGQPLVTTVDAQGRLTLDGVIGAYRSAFALADKAMILAGRGGYMEPSTGWAAINYDEHKMVIVDPYERARALGMLREVDVPAFDGAVSAVKELQALDLSRDDLANFAGRACIEAERQRTEDAANDAEVTLWAVVASADYITEHVQDAREEAEEGREYERERERWISEHGSERLRKAAERGYRHDGIYRDERLAVELPGFLGWLGKNPQVREAINPSEVSLRLEDEALQRVQEFPEEMEVRIVWVVTGLDSDAETGEYIRIDNYLGRHTVYQPAVTNNDIPF